MPTPVCATPALPAFPRAFFLSGAASADRHDEMPAPGGGHVSGGLLLSTDRSHFRTPPAGAATSCALVVETPLRVLSTAGVCVASGERTSDDTGLQGGLAALATADIAAAATAAATADCGGYNVAVVSSPSRCSPSGACPTLFAPVSAVDTPAGRFPPASGVPVSNAKHAACLALLRPGSSPSQQPPSAVEADRSGGSGGVANSSTGLGSVTRESAAALEGAPLPQLSSSLVKTNCCALVDDAIRLPGLRAALPMAQRAGSSSPPSPRRTTAPRHAVVAGATSFPRPSSNGNFVADGILSQVSPAKALSSAAVERFAASIAPPDPDPFACLLPSFSEYDKSSPRPHTPAAQFVSPFAAAPSVKQGFSLPLPPLQSPSPVSAAPVGVAAAEPVLNAARFFVTFPPGCSRAEDIVAAADPATAAVLTFSRIARLSSSPLIELPWALPPLISDPEPGTTRSACPAQSALSFNRPVPDVFCPPLHLSCKCRAS